MDIHVTNKTNKSWEVVYIINKVRQLFSMHRVSKIDFVSLVRGSIGRKNAVCCAVGELMPALLRTICE